MRVIKVFWGFSKVFWGRILGAAAKTPKFLGGYGLPEKKIKENEEIGKNRFPHLNFTDSSFCKDRA